MSDSTMKYEPANIAEDYSANAQDESAPALSHSKQNVEIQTSSNSTKRLLSFIVLILITTSLGIIIGLRVSACNQIKSSSTQKKYHKIVQVIKEGAAASFLQKRFVPNFQCKAEYFVNFDQNQSFTTHKNVKISKVPYPQVVLVQEKNEPAPINHYQEVAVFIKNSQGLSFIYVHQAPLYALLIIAASSSQQTSIILSHSYSRPKLATLLFVFNNIKQKLIIEKEEEQQENVQKSDLIVISDQNYRKYNHNKTILIIVSEGMINTSPVSTYKLKTQKTCGPVQKNIFTNQILNSGAYIITPT